MVNSPSQKRVTQSFDVFFDMHLNKRLSKLSWGWWFETPSCSLWCHCKDLRVKLNNLCCFSANELQKMDICFKDLLNRFIILRFSYASSIADSQALNITLANHHYCPLYDRYFPNWHHRGHNQPLLLTIWISNDIHYKVLGEITYSFPYINSAGTEVWKWINKFIQHFTGHVITYPSWD